jgi:two-component system CheB/CheR fusion protein
MEQEKYKSLRERAEDKLQDSLMNFDNYSLKDIKSLIHEIQVHQVELEMQNDELRRAQESIKKTEEKYDYYYNFSPVAHVNIDENGYILNSNFTFDKMIGKSKDDLLRTDFNNLVEWDDRDAFYHIKKNIIEGKLINSERLILKNGDISVPVEVSAKKYENNDIIFMTIVDISRIVDLENKISQLENN